MTIQADDRHLVEYEAGLLWITDKSTLETWVVGLTNSKGQSIVKGDYDKSCKTHGPERTIKVFKMIATDDSPVKCYKYLPGTRD